MDWTPPIPKTPTDLYYESLSALPTQVQMMVMHSRELERVNRKAASKFLAANPQVVIARQQAAYAALRKRPTSTLA